MARAVIHEWIIISERLAKSYSGSTFLLVPNNGGISLREVKKNYRTEITAYLFKLLPIGQRFCDRSPFASERGWFCRKVHFTPRESRAAHLRDVESTATKNTLRPKRNSRTAAPHTVIQNHPSLTHPVTRSELSSPEDTGRPPVIALFRILRRPRRAERETRRD